MSPLFLSLPLLTKAEVCSSTERLTKHPAKPSALHTATDLLSTEKKKKKKEKKKMVMED